jgi:prepilin-type N-terminal cleavage/methylation domain-containing protein
VGEKNALSAGDNIEADENFGDTIMEKLILRTKGFTLVELIISMIIMLSLISMVTPSFFNNINNNSLDSSAQKFYSDLEEIRLYSMTGRWVNGTGGARLFGPRESGWNIFRRGCGGNWVYPYGYKTMIESSHDCSQIASFVDCFNFEFLKSSSDADSSARPEDTTFEDNVIIDGASEIKKGNMIFFDCSGMPYFAIGCGWPRVPMTNANNELKLKYDIPSGAQTRTIRIDPATGRITISALWRKHERRMA